MSTCYSVRSGGFDLLNFRFKFLAGIFKGLNEHEEKYYYKTQ
jgi:hypothetical protein